jgi:outer membrane immunogenic protein
MRRLALALVATAALTQLASAADLPAKVYTKAPAMVAAYNWTGWYVGGNIGYGWGGSTGNDLTVADPAGIFVGYAALGGFRYPSVKPKGVVGGAQIGYNWQNGAIVWGAVADLQFSGMKDDQTVNVPALGIFFPETQSHSSKIQWFGTVRGRVGYAANNFLPYITGGLAYGKVQGNLHLFIPTSGFIMDGTNTTTRAGWTAGAGFEYGLTNWTFGVEYLHVDLGNASVTATATTPPFVLPGEAISMNQRFTADIVRALANVRF